MSSLINELSSMVASGDIVIDIVFDYDVKSAGIVTGETPNGVRVTHIPTGLSVVSTGLRSQYENRRLALTIMVGELREIGVTKCNK